VGHVIISNINNALRENSQKVTNISRDIVVKITTMLNDIKQKIRMIEAMNPEKVLKQGYAIISGKMSPGEKITVTTDSVIAEAEITKVTKKVEN